MLRLLGALCAAVLLVAPGAAWGVQVIEPPPGSTVDAPVQSVRVVVGAPVEPGLARARVTAPDGSSASLVRVTPADPEALVIPVPAGGRGTYRVAWWGLTTDGHPFAGTSSFAVGSASPAAVAVAPEGKDGAGWLAMLARFLVLVGVLGTAGMAACREWVVGGAWRSGGIAPPGADTADGVRGSAAAVADLPVRAWWITWWGLVAAWVVGLAIALPVHAAATGGQWGDLLGGSRWGSAWAGLAVLAVAAAVAGMVARIGEPRVGPPGPRMYAAAVPGVLGAVLLSWSGHAASGTDATLGVAIDVLHGWATAAWLGGLVMLLALGLPLLGRMAEGPRLALGAGIVVRFSSVAVAAVVLLVVTGVYRALAELPSLASLWTTSYGVALLVKLIVFAVMFVLAAWNRLVLHPRLERAALGLGSAAPGDGIGALRTSVRAEVALGAVVMLAVAVLVGLVPPT
jgi:copper transport protein